MVAEIFVFHFIFSQTNSTQPNLTRNQPQQTPTNPNYAKTKLNKCNTSANTKY